LEAPEARFMLVFLGIASIVLTPVAVEISEKERLPGNLLKFAAIIWIGVITLGNGLIQWKSLPFVFGAIDRDQYIQSQMNGRFSHALEWYDSFVFINKNLRQDAKILFPDFHFYYCDRTIVTTLEAKLFNLQKREIEDDLLILKRLKKIGITHILTKEESKVEEKDYKRYLYFNGFLKKMKKLGRIKELYMRDGITLFEMVPPSQ
jgi:hypothetical protein